ncbi:hypothetical protein ABID56_001484 [Alkalibacillus flavidus]|uniref:Uncharacterized protein n=1 Tax=Alkalibacillus flavidus TaxID=546021 RepID=A0ABV2KUZ5_9BACI
MREKKPHPGRKVNPQAKHGRRAFSDQDRKRKEQNVYNRGGF